ncbi:MAG TPA: uroporphyrinogen-III synthase [Gammaproteobacteria bacterium]|nr:uroporphyrinogen-III synthase [Gammaproteobacteria bacterium]
MTAGGPLAGLTVMVTRPARQAGGLCRAIEAAGGRALSLPGVEIAAPRDPADARRHLASAGEYDWLIFVSRNAVSEAAPLLGTPLAELAPRVAAVGRGTAAALERVGCEPAVRPAAGGGSEALLEHPALRSVRGRAVLIVRGEGGRELLARTLAARGARVDYAEVYRRRRPRASRQRLETLLAGGMPQVVTATSAAILENLVAMFPAGSLRESLLAAQLVVVSERMIKMARTLGFRRPPLLADAPSDDALVAAIVRWRKSDPDPGGSPGPGSAPRV